MIILNKWFEMLFLPQTMLVVRTIIMTTFTVLTTSIAFCCKNNPQFGDMFNME